MKNLNEAEKWLRRAKSNFACAKTGKISKDILYEDLCFDAQQAVEKALKALCIYQGVIFPKTHGIAYLLELLEKQNIAIPDDIQKAKLLTDYAVELRYPGDYEPVSDEDYQTAVLMAEKVLVFVEKIIKR